MSKVASIAQKYQFYQRFLSELSVFLMHLNGWFVWDCEISEA